MVQSAFEQLEVYSLAKQLAQEIWLVVLRWNAFARSTLGVQAIKAADSIGANIAEGFGRGTAKENARFVRISRGSLCEIIHWMRTAFRRDLLTTQQVAGIKPLIDELGPKMNGYLRSITRFNRPAGGVGHRAVDNDRRSTINDQQSKRRDTHDRP